MNDGLPRSPARTCYPLERGAPARPLAGDPGKLDPDLRALLAARRAEAVRVTVEFRGELADLEAAGFVRHSLVTHPTQGYRIATGTIPVDALEALSAIEHLTAISAPQPLSR